MENALITWMSEKKGGREEGRKIGGLNLWLSGCCVVVVDDVVCTIVR